MRLHFQADLTVGRGEWMGVTARARVTLDMSRDTWLTGTGPVILSGRVIRVSSVIRGLLSGQTSWSNERIDVAGYRLDLAIDRNGKRAKVQAHTASGWGQFNGSASFSGPGPGRLPITVEGTFSGFIVQVIETADPVLTQPERPVTPKFIATDFLRGGANGSWGRGPLFYFSHQLPDGEALALAQGLAAAGYNSITPYLFNDGDGAGLDVAVDAHQHGELVSRRIREAFDAGLTRIDPILFADDSSRITGQPTASLVQMAQRALLQHGASFTDVCTFLEPGELNDDAKVNAVSAAAAEVMGRKVKIHTMPIMSGGKVKFESLRYHTAPWCAGLWVQTGNPDKPIALSQTADVVQKVNDHVGADHWIPFEYAFEHRGGAALGARFIDLQCRGVGNGATPEKLKQLAARFGGGQPSPPPAPPAGPQFWNLKTQSNAYVTWECSPEVDRWKKDREDCVGWLMLNDVPCEKFRSGYRRQHLRNAYGTDEHSVRGIQQDGPVRLRLQAISDSRLRTNEITFNWPWKGT